MPLLSITRYAPAASSDRILGSTALEAEHLLIGSDAGASGSEAECSDDDDDDDDDYVRGKRSLGGARQTRRRRRRKDEPDLRELSLPKAAQRLDVSLDLSDGALSGCAYHEHAPHTLGVLKPPKDTPSPATQTTLELVLGRRTTRGQPEDERVAQYRTFYSVQLPGMPFYNDACHLLACAGGTVTGGSTFRLVDVLTTSRTRVLILDVLALAANPASQGKGVGSLCISSLKALAQREAAALRARPLLLTQVRRYPCVHAHAHAHVHAHVLLT